MTYLRDLERELKVLLNEGDEAKVIRFVKEKAPKAIAMAWTRCHSALIRPHKSSNGRFELRNRNRGGAHGGAYPPLSSINTFAKIGQLARASVGS